MENLLSAVLSELTSRSLNFFISKFSQPTPVDVEDRLRRVLLRAQVIVDEAMGRHITNQAMLLQLDMVRDAMYRGYYMLDSFSCQSHNEDNKDKVGRVSSSLSKVNSLKRLSFSSTGRVVLKQLQETHEDLNSMIHDVQELVMFLMSYPRMSRQPYSMHLQLANCMFDRHVEAQFVTNFLLNVQPLGHEGVEVLPIVGPGQVGKSTLVAHVCKDDRVRDHFSEILFFNIHGFTDDEVATFQKGCADHVSNSNLGRRLLVVIELIGDLSEDAWNRLDNASKECATSGSKIIVTSRSSRIVKFGTTQALTLKYLSHEAYWYFFKTITFESMDPEMHPRLTHLAMEIAKTMGNSSLISANVTARLLRENLNIHFWCKVLIFLRGVIQRHVSRFGEHPINFLNENRSAHIARMASSSEEFMVHHRYQCFPEEEVPQIRFEDVMYGSVKPHGKFEILAWKSPIPPYYSYVHTCEIRELQTTAAKRKR